MYRKSTAQTPIAVIEAVGGMDEIHKSWLEQHPAEQYPDAEWREQAWQTHLERMNEFLSAICKIGIYEHPDTNN